jgi:hypothetical protein
MARIGIPTCSNCTQESHCASVVCLGDMRKREGFFEGMKIAEVCPNHVQAERREDLRNARYRGADR